MKEVVNFILNWSKQCSMEYVGVLCINDDCQLPNLKWFQICMRQAIYCRELKPKQPDCRYGIMAIY